jgi:hypothetical protein
MEQRIPFLEEDPQPPSQSERSMDPAGNWPLLFSSKELPRYPGASLLSKSAIESRALFPIVLILPVSRKDMA